MRSVPPECASRPKADRLALREHRGQYHVSIGLDLDGLKSEDLRGGVDHSPRRYDKAHEGVNLPWAVWER